MEISIADQIALDDALVAPADRLKIGKCNLRLSSDVTSKEATLQVVYDVVKLTSLFYNIPFHCCSSRDLYARIWASADVLNDTIEKKYEEGNAMYYPRFTKCRPTFVMDKDPSILEETRNEDTQLYGAILPTELTNEDIRISESYKEYHAIASGKIPPKTKGSKKKADTYTTIKMKPPTVPKEKKENKSGKGKQKTTELETISEAIRHWRVTPGVPDAPDYDSEDDISWKSSDDDQDDENEDKNDVNETTQDDEDDDVHDEDENAQADDDEEQTESEDDGDDFIHPKLTTHDDEIIHEEETDEDDTFDPIVHTPSHISSSDDEDSDNDVEGTNLKSIDVILPQSSSVSSGFVSNMLNPNQDTGVDDIFEQHAEATSLIDTPVTAIVEPSFSAPTNRPPTPNPLEAVDVAVQLKYDRIREVSNTKNQQFLDSIEKD
ncbi:hypothetical protein Tco_0428611 [Tanacetum coccineum]